MCPWAPNQPTADGYWSYRGTSIWYGELSCGSNRPMDWPVSISNSMLAVPPPYSWGIIVPAVPACIRARVLGMGSSSRSKPLRRVGSVNDSLSTRTTLTSSSEPVRFLFTLAAAFTYLVASAFISCSE